MTTGIKVSLSGIDVKRARDSELFMSSEFKTLPIAKEGKYEINVITDKQTVVKHGLGFQPIYLVYIVESTTGSTITITRGLVGQSSEYTFSVDKENLYIVPPALGAITSNNKYYYYIFNRSLVDNILPTSEKPGESKETNIGKDKFGIKASEDGNDVKTSSELTIDSSKNNLVIHSLKSMKLGSETEYTFEHNLGYTSMVWTYFSSLLSNFYTSDEYLFWNDTGSISGSGQDYETIYTDRVVHKMTDSPLTSRDKMIKVIFKNPIG